jgi:hypothetical protein
MKRITIFLQNNLGSQKKGGCKSRQKKNLNPAYFISEFTRADDVTPLSGGPLSEGDYQRQVHKVVVVTFRFFRSLPCVVVYVAPWRLSVRARLSASKSSSITACSTLDLWLDLFPDVLGYFLHEVEVVFLRERVNLYMFVTIFELSSSFPSFLLVLI